MNGVASEPRVGILSRLELIDLLQPSQLAYVVHVSATHMGLQPLNRQARDVACKTLMGLHFTFHGATLGQPGVIASFQENETQLGRIVKSFGWSLDDPGVHLLSRSPVDLYLDEWVYQLLDLIDRVGEASDDRQPRRP